MALLAEEFLEIAVEPGQEIPYLRNIVIGDSTGGDMIDQGIDLASYANGADTYLAAFAAPYDSAQRFFGFGHQVEQTKNAVADRTTETIEMLFVPGFWSHEDPFNVT